VAATGLLLPRGGEAMMIGVRVGGSGRVLVAVLAVTACDKLTGGGDSGEAAAEAQGDPPAAEEPAAEGDAKVADAEPAPDGETAPAADTPKDEPAEAPADTPNLAAADGPKVAWSTAFTSTPRAVSIEADGTLVVVFEDRMKGYQGGAQKWEKEGAFTDLVRLQDGTLAVSSGASVLAFQPSTGEESFRVEIAGKRKGKAAPAEIVAITTLGSQVLAATTEATFHVIDPPACVGKQPACLRPAGALEGEYLEHTAELVASDDGTRFLVEDTAMRAFDLGLDLDFEVQASARIVAAVPVPGGRIAVAHGGAIALLDVVGCIGKGGVVHLGASAGPKGCGLWRYGSGLDLVPPAVVDRDTLAVNGDHRLQAVTRGTDSWKTPIGAIGRVIAGEGGLLYTMCVEDATEGAGMSVKAITADKGTAAWVVALPFAPSESKAVVAGDLRFDQQDGFVVAGWAENAAVLAIPVVEVAAAPTEQAPAAAPTEPAPPEPAG
jgi:hypothetical protein